MTRARANTRTRVRVVNVPLYQKEENAALIGLSTNA
jgi:hypothetical protein